MPSLLSSSLLPRLFPLSSLLQDEISRTKHTGGVEERAVIKDETRRRTRRGKRRRRRRGKRRGGRGEERGLKSKWKNERGRRRKKTKKEFSPNLLFMQEIRRRYLCCHANVPGILSLCSTLRDLYSVDMVVK